jgi:hypothetical protein
MKTKYILILIGVAAIAAVLFMVGQRPLEGEVVSNRGRAFFFADGLVAVDYSDPVAYYLIEYDPKIITDVEIQDKGVEVFFKKGSMPWKDEPGRGSAPVKVRVETKSTLIGRPQTGRISVCRQEKEGSCVLQASFDTGLIDALVEAQNWDASIKPLLSRLEH